MAAHKAAFLIATLFVAPLLFVQVNGRADVLFLYERVSLFLSPSVERAYEYGARHFDAIHATSYDIDSAEYFFTRAAELNPRHPLIQHQLARIAFLRGNFPLALLRINSELKNNPTPSSYYVRGLIKGYAGDYTGAAVDYKRYLAYDPHNWAAINDYAWVLLKSKKAREAVVVTAGGLAHFSENPWLLNTNAIGLYEIGLLAPSLEQARKALRAVRTVSKKEWLVAYPGNDPKIAQEGIGTLQDSVRKNIHTLLLAPK